VIGLAATIYGLIIAQSALSQYKRDNRLSALVKLDEKEARIYDRVLENDFLHSFWAEFPDSLTPREKMALQLRLLVRPEDNSKSPDTVADLKFTTVQDLDRVVWAYDSFGNPMFRRLRDAYVFAEEILLMAESTYIAYKAGILTKDDWRSIDTYIDDVGSHPLFIEAVYWGHGGANYSKAFAEVLMHKYSHNAELKEAALLIYPSIVTDQRWAETMGSRETPE
jgi:hypothetical protein